MTNADLANILHALLGNITDADFDMIVKTRHSMSSAALNGNLAQSGDATSAHLGACALAVNNMPAGVRGHIVGKLATSVFGPVAAMVDEDQLASLRGIEQRLHAGSDKMRDEGHKLWLTLNQIEGK